MFKPARMVSVNIIALNDDTQHVTSLLAKEGVVHLSNLGAISGVEYVSTMPQKDALEKRYKNAEQSLKRIEEVVNETIKGEISPDTMQYDLLREIDIIENALKEIISKVDGIFANKKMFEEEIRKYKDLAICAKYLHSRNINIEHFENLEFLFLKLGFLPSDKMESLKRGIGDTTLIVSLVEKGAKTLVAVLALRDDEKAVNKVLESVFFQEVIFPVDLEGKSHEIYLHVEKRIAGFKHELAQLNNQIKELHKIYHDQLQRIADAIASAQLHFYARGYFKSTRDLVLISGWVPKKRVEQFETSITAQIENVLVLKDYSLKSKINIPTKLENVWFMKPFEGLISVYGLPDYKEVDPTFYVMLGFSLMFGMMFGDLGQGLLLLLVGIIVRKKVKSRMGKSLGFMLGTCGVMASIFGIFFGSIFGFEHVIPALLFNPFEEINLMLAVGIFFGVGFISVGVLINIINMFMQGKTVDALLGQKGLSGMLFYFGSVLTVFGLVMNYSFAQNILVVLLLILLPLVFVALKEPVEFYVHRMHEKTLKRETIEEKSGLEIFVMSIMEVYDTILGYLSNTMSFMRIAAFSLNHVGLLIAVFTIGEMFDPNHDHTGIGFWITVIIGNIFVIVLEGMIVTIQTLRLIYYEGFSKFFSGNGMEYKPFSVSQNDDTAME
ncbi:MAG: V-type ATPase 116kDa subunit family protein [Candidatus Ancaeobacter aquaticus]|nr:V-type ATPase 116kDa subunit family protein [Candidatus Ancaeobacter aquaticus]